MNNILIGNDFPFQFFYISYERRFSCQGECHKFPNSQVCTFFVLSFASGRFFPFFFCNMNISG